MELVIGNKNYSSWSLRPWLLLTEHELSFSENHESLRQERLKERLRRHSPTCRVPVLLDKDLTVWDSLAICEYVSETYLEGRGWPVNNLARATARSICAEMHAGFNALRAELPLNIRASRTVNLSSAVQEDIARIDAIWSDCRNRWSSPGRWLFDQFSIADCFFAPVVLRFVTYSIPLSAAATDYMTTVTNNRSVKLWIHSALQETEVVPEDEAGT